MSVKGEEMSVERKKKVRKCRWKTVKTVYKKNKIFVYKKNKICYKYIKRLL